MPLLNTATSATLTKVMPCIHSVGQSRWGHVLMGIPARLSPMTDTTAGDHRRHEAFYPSRCRWPGRPRRSRVYTAPQVMMYPPSATPIWHLAPCASA